MSCRMTSTDTQDQPLISMSCVLNAQPRSHVKSPSEWAAVVEFAAARWSP